MVETIEIFWPMSALRSVDFPELGRPMIAAVPDFIMGRIQDAGRRIQDTGWDAGFLRPMV